METLFEVIEVYLLRMGADGLCKLRGRSKQKTICSCTLKEKLPCSCSPSKCVPAKLVHVSAGVDVLKPMTDDDDGRCQCGYC